MKITFLGTSHGIPEKNQFCQSILISVGKNHYVVDAGAPISTLLKNHDVDCKDVKGIFITHSHGDHTGGLTDFTGIINCFGCYANVRIPVYVPDEDRYRRMFDYVFGSFDMQGVRKNSSLFGENESDESRMKFQTYKAGEIFNDGVIKVTAIPVGHYVNAHAFLVESKDGKRVIFCGDMRDDLLDYPREIIENENDLVVIEGAHQDLDSKWIIDIIYQSNTKKMALTHCNFARNTKEKIAVLQNAVKDKFPLEIAYDTMVIEL